MKTRKATVIVEGPKLSNLYSFKYLKGEAKENEGQIFRVTWPNNQDTLFVASFYSDKLWSQLMPAETLVPKKYLKKEIKVEITTGKIYNEAIGDLIKDLKEDLTISWKVTLWNNDYVKNTYLEVESKAKEKLEEYIYKYNLVAHAETHPTVDKKVMYSNVNKTLAFYTPHSSLKHAPGDTSAQYITYQDMLNEIVPLLLETAIEKPSYNKKEWVSLEKYYNLLINNSSVKEDIKYLSPFHSTLSNTAIPEKPTNTHPYFQTALQSWSIPNKEEYPVSNQKRKPDICWHIDNTKYIDQFQQDLYTNFGIHSSARRVKEQVFPRNINITSCIVYGWYYGNTIFNRHARNQTRKAIFNDIDPFANRRNILSPFNISVEIKHTWYTFEKQLPWPTYIDDYENFETLTTKKLKTKIKTSTETEINN